MVGPHWSKGWIIEHCHLHHARCSAISLGAPAFIGDNRWTREKVKHGTQREREVVFAALNNGWSRENIGSHIVRHNHLHDCEQTAICGHLGGIFSHIHHNHIHHTYIRRRFGGHEMAGIKLHAPIDVRIEPNRIHDSHMAVWLDWQAQGTRVSRNVCYRNDRADFYVEVSHGPCTVDHNFFLSPTAIRNCSQGNAFVHNFIAGLVFMSPIPIRYTPYHQAHSTAVARVMTILSGDDRWFGNLFVAQRDLQPLQTDSTNDENATMDKFIDRGLAIYNSYPIPSDDWCTGNSVPAYASHRLPVAINGNAYANAITAWNREEVFLHGGEATFALHEADDGRVELQVRLDEALTKFVPATSAEQLGEAFQPEVPFAPSPTLGSDAPSLLLDRDFAHHPRSSLTYAGPFQQVGTDNSWQLWPSAQ
jgi:hypothetical protein